VHHEWVRNLILILLLSGVSMAFGASCSGPESAFPREEPTPSEPTPAADGEVRQAVFAGGCFWCTEAVFQSLNGVSEVVSGYAGGTAETANYDAVCSGATDHAEAIRIVYDPAKVDYETLLEIFFFSHDPTTLNRQGPDMGRQYRSAIFYADEEEKRRAEAYIARLNESGDYDRPIVTTLEPMTAFYVAEEVHQDFARRKPNHPYIRANATPKVEKVKKLGK
jgi:methionine-S-sulfoxide reductase